MCPEYCVRCTKGIRKMINLELGNKIDRNLSLYSNQEACPTRAYLSFLSMKQLGVS